MNENLKQQENNQEAEQNQIMLNCINSTLEDIKAINPVVIDVRKLTDVTDYMVICSATSARHSKTIAEYILKALNEMKIKPLYKDIDNSESWLALDYSNIIIHIMDEESREHYQLEKLWQNVVDRREQAEDGDEL